LRVRRARHLPAQRLAFIGLGDGGLRFKMQPNCDNCDARSRSTVNIRLYGTPVHFVAHALFQETYSSTPATSCRLLDWAKEMHSFGTIVPCCSLERSQRSRPSQLYGRVPYNLDAYNWILTVPPSRPQSAEWLQHTTERASWGQPPQPVGLKRSHASPQPPFHGETMLGGDTPYAPPGADHPHPLRLRVADIRTELSCFVFHCCRERTGL